MFFIFAVQERAMSSLFVFVPGGLALKGTLCALVNPCLVLRSVVLQ